MQINFTILYCLPMTYKSIIIANITKRITALTFISRDANNYIWFFLAILVQTNANITCILSTF